MTTRKEIFARAEGCEVQPSHRVKAQMLLDIHQHARALWFYNLAGVHSDSNRVTAPSNPELQEWGLVEPYPLNGHLIATALTKEGCLVVMAMLEIKGGKCFV